MTGYGEPLKNIVLLNESVRQVANCVTRFWRDGWWVRRDTTSGRPETFLRELLFCGIIPLLIADFAP